MWAWGLSSRPLAPPPFFVSTMVRSKTQRERALIRQQVLGSPFLSSMADSFLGKLTKLLHVKSFEHEEVIFEEGTLATHVFILAAGMVKVIVGTIPVTILGEGEIFGETGYWACGKRTATLRSQFNCLCLSVDCEELMLLLEKFPSEKGRFEQLAFHRLRRSRQQHLFHSPTTPMKDPCDEAKPVAQGPHQVRSCVVTSEEARGSPCAATGRNAVRLHALSPNAGAALSLRGILPTRATSCLEKQETERVAHNSGPDLSSREPDGLPERKVRFSTTVDINAYLPPGCSQRRSYPPPFQVLSFQLQTDPAEELPLRRSGAVLPLKLK